jgi:hypothetical protein
MRKFNIAEEKLAMRPAAYLLGDLASPEHFLNDPRLSRSPMCSTAPLSPHLAATRLSGRLTLKVRCVWRNGWRRWRPALSARRHRDVLLARAGFAGRRKRGVSERAEHLVEYTHSKSTIEQLMQQHCPTLPLVIARPLLWWAILITAAGLPAVFSGCSAWG